MQHQQLRAIIDIGDESPFLLWELNASLFALAVLPLSTAYADCQDLRCESGVSNAFEDAPASFGIHTPLFPGLLH